jgi:hypothetical protein
MDFINDSSLQCLPLAMRQKMQVTQDTRIAAGFTADNGVTYQNAAKRDHVNAILSWQAAGKPADGLSKLQAEEKRLRASGEF